MAEREESESPDTTFAKTKPHSKTKKRLPPESSDTGDSSSTEGSKLRKLCEKSDSSASEESSSSTTVSVTAIPQRTSQWTTNVLDLLRILVERGKCPTVTNLFKKWLESVMTEKKDSLANIQTRASNIIEHMDSFDALGSLDFDNIYDMNSKSARPFYTRSAEGCTPWTNHLIPPLDTEKHWSHTFTTYVDKFAEDLRFMCSIHQEGRTIKEAMYGELFQDFIGLCGVHSFAVPLVETKDLKIGNTEVRSIPDMLLMDRETDGAGRKILVVIKAERTYDYEGVQNYSPPETGSRNLQLHAKSGLTISDKLIGQHGGELLLHCPMSSNKYGMLGMIVQNTHVAFTYLSCDVDQFENIANGKPSEENHSSLTISKFYNFLKASDRKELVEPFVILGLLQTIP